MDEFLELEAVLEKADLMVLERNRGDLNSRDVTIGDKTYAPDVLVFCGFVGRIHMPDKLYRGSYMFRLSQQRDADRDRFDVGRLPNAVAFPVAPSAPEPVANEEEKEGVDDEL